MTNLSGLTEDAINRILPSAIRALNTVISMFGNEDGWELRSGGFFCLADARTGLPWVIAQLGEISNEKVEKYLAFCQEKARRLALHPEHTSSWQSRNPEDNQWGGAIRCGKYIYSFSGLPELGDEALMMYAAAICDGLLYTSNLDTIALNSSNPYWFKLQELRC